MRRGGGLVVNLLTLYSDDPSFFRLILFEYKQKEAGLIACTSNASRVLVYMYVIAAAYCKLKTIPYTKLSAKALSNTYTYLRDLTSIPFLNDCLF